METAHRRIDLQSPADLAHLERAASAAAAAKLDLHLPPSTAGGEDELRVAVESLVNEFVARTWRGARMSVSVNGIDLPATEGGEGGDGKDRAVGVEGTSFFFFSFHVAFYSESRTIWMADSS